MGLLVLRIFAGVFVLSSLIALMSGAELGRIQQANQAKGSFLTRWARFWRGEDIPTESHSIHWRFRFCVQLSTFSFVVVLGSIVLAMMEG